jgi:type IV pilus assembly protein PilV
MSLIELQLRTKYRFTINAQFENLMNKNTGFTLIEILIAVLILATGILGLAGLQASILKNNQSAYNRSQATQFAYDMADRMRANASVANNYITTFTVPTEQSDCSTVSTTCTKADMAINDLYQWNTAISASLPSGKGTITLAGTVFTITINWDDNRDGDVDGDGGAHEGDRDGDGDTDDDPNFQMSFQL